MAHCIQTGEKIIYPSIYSASIDLDINPGTIKLNCDRMRNVKSGISKKNNNNYSFSYSDEKPNIMIKLGKKYLDEEDMKTQMELLRNRKEHCKCCDIYVKYQNIKTHNKSKTHFNNINKIISLES